MINQEKERKNNEYNERDNREKHRWRYTVSCQRDWFLQSPFWLCRWNWMTSLQSTKRNEKCLLMKYYCDIDLLFGTHSKSICKFNDRLWVILMFFFFYLNSCYWVETSIWRYIYILGSIHWDNNVIKQTKHFLCRFILI